MQTSKEKTILVVDDDPDVVAYLRTLLEDDGFSVMEAGNGQEGFAAAKSERPDLVILDINMPKEYGLRMYRNLHDDPQTSAIPVVFVTGVSHEYQRFIRFLERSWHVSAPAGYFDKPLDRELLLATINKILGCGAPAAGRKAASQSIH